MLNHYDKEILKRDEKIYNLEQQVNILKGQKDSLIAEIKDADEEIRELECKLKPRYHKNVVAKLGVMLEGNIFKVLITDSLSKKLYEVTTENDSLIGLSETIFRGFEKVLGLNGRYMEYIEHVDHTESISKFKGKYILKAIKFNLPMVKHIHGSSHMYVLNEGKLVIDNIVSFLNNTLYGDSPYIVGVLSHDEVIELM